MGSQPVTSQRAFWRHCYRQGHDYGKQAKVDSACDIYDIQDALIRSLAAPGSWSGHTGLLLRHVSRTCRCPKRLWSKQ